MAKQKETVKSVARTTKRPKKVDPISPPLEKPVDSRERSNHRLLVMGCPEMFEDNEEEEACWIAAVYCVRMFPMLLTVGGSRELPSFNGQRRWIIAVHLRYPTGFEGYVGDLLCEGVRITELTEREEMDQRSREIDADPERERQWNEYVATHFPPGERQDVCSIVSTDGSGGVRHKSRGKRPARGSKDAAKRNFH